MKKFGLLLALPVMLFTLAGCGNTTEVKEEVIKIGTISPLSGDAAAYGEQVLRVFDEALATANEKAAEKNIKFELVHEDGKCTGSDAVSAYQKLKDIDGVKFIIGGFCSSETLALAPLSQNGEVLLTSVASSNPEIEGASPYVYTFSYSDSVVGETIANEISKGNKRIAIITEQNDYNIGVRDTFLKALEGKEGVEIVANETFPKGGSDFRVTLEKIKNANPDAVLLNPNAGITAQNLLKQLAEMQGWEEVKLYGQVAFMPEEVLALAPEMAEGMIIVDSPSITNEDLLALKEKIETEKGSLENLGNYYTASTLDTVNILTDLLVEKGEDVNAVRDALKEGTFDGYIGEIHFGDKHFPGVDGGVYVVKNGKAEFRTE